MSEIIFPEITTKDVEEYGKEFYKIVEKRYINKINDAHVRSTRSVRMRLVMSWVWFGVSLFICTLTLLTNSSFLSNVSLGVLLVGCVLYLVLSCSSGDKWRVKRRILEIELGEVLSNWDIACGWYEKEEAFIPNKQFYECLKSLESVRDDDEFKFDMYNGEIHIQSFINGFKHSDFKIDLSENQSAIRMIVKSEGVCDFTYLDDWYKAYDKKMGEWKML